MKKILFASLLLIVLGALIANAANSRSYIEVNVIFGLESEPVQDALVEFFTLDGNFYFDVTDENGHCGMPIPAGFYHMAVTIDGVRYGVTSPFSDGIEIVGYKIMTVHFHEDDDSPSYHFWGPSGK